VSLAWVFASLTRRLGRLKSYAVVASTFVHRRLHMSHSMGTQVTYIFAQRQVHSRAMLNEIALIISSLGAGGLIGAFAKSFLDKR
jgi:hypothetical protein